MSYQTIKRKFNKDKDKDKDKDKLIFKCTGATQRKYNLT